MIYIVIFSENNYELPNVNTLSEKYAIDKDVVTLILKYHALADHVNTMEGDEVVYSSWW